MKKNVILTVICLSLGTYMGYIMFSDYKKEETKPVSISAKIDKLYFLQIGVYSSLDKMKNALPNLQNYIYNEDNNLYYVYVGITKNKEVLSKLEGYFKKQGYNIYVKEFENNNLAFSEVLTQYDNLLKETADEKAINVACSQVLEKYEELVMNVKSEGNS